MRDEIKKLKKAVREKCLECSGGTPAEIALCELEDCPLYPYRVELWPSLFDTKEKNCQSPAGQEEEKNATPPPADQLRLF